MFVCVRTAKQRIGTNLKKKLMAKDPAFLFYFRDFLVSTDLMTNEEVGAHIRVLCHLADKGHLHENSIRERICGSIWDSIRERYRQDQDGRWYNKRLEAVLKERKEFVENRLNNLKGSSHGKPTRKRHKATPHGDISISNSTSTINSISKKKKQPDKPVDPRFKEFISIFNAFYEAKYGREYVYQAKDYGQLKSLLRTKGVDGDRFRAAMNNCYDDNFHLGNFSLYYICAKFSILENLNHRKDRPKAGLPPGWAEKEDVETGI
jgi:hypothetical protein